MSYGTKLLIIIFNIMLFNNRIERKLYEKEEIINKYITNICVLFLASDTYSEVSTYSNYYKSIRSDRINEIIEANNRVFILYYKVSCLPCSSLKEKLNDIIKKQKIKNIYAVDIEDDYFSDLSNITIKSTPTMILYKDKKEVKRIEENVSKQKLLEFLK